MSKRIYIADAIQAVNQKVLIQGFIDNLKRYYWKDTDYNRKGNPS